MKSSVFKPAIFLIASLAFSAAQADTETVDGIEWSYTISDGEATISSGSSKTPAIPNTTSEAITIPSSLGGCPVTSIGNVAFYECSGLTEVTIPEGVTKIGSSAFYKCARISRITIPSSMKDIGFEALYWCESLKSVTIPEGVTNIGSVAFYGCSSLTSVVIPSSVMNIDYGAFVYCSSLTNVTISSGVKIIDSYAFASSGLTSVTIPASVTNIHSYAFSTCSKLNAVDFEGAPPTGLANAGFKTGVAIRYNVAYETQWDPMVTQCGWTNATSYTPDDPETEDPDPVENPPDITLNAVLDSGEVKLSWSVNKELSAEISFISVSAWKNADDVGDSGDSWSIYSNVTNYNVPLIAREIMNGTSYRYFAVCYCFNDGASLKSDIVDLSNVIPKRIAPVITSTTLENGILKLAWQIEAYTSDTDDAAKCDLPEGWPWGQYCYVFPYGQNRSENGLGIGEWMMMGYGSSFETIEINQSAYAVAKGTQPVIYQLRLNIDGVETTGPNTDVSSLFPSGIRIEASGTLDTTGTINFTWEPKAYKNTPMGEQACDLPEGWPWMQGSVSLCGSSAARGSYNPYCDMPINGYEYLMTDSNQLPFMLGAYDVAMGLANNVYCIRYTLISPAYSTYTYGDSGMLYSELIDLREEIPGYIRIEAQGSLNEYGVLNITWEPHAYESSMEGAAECKLPEGWPWAQGGMISVRGEQASMQTINPSCSMPVMGLEYVYGGSAQLTLSAYEVAMGFAYNVYRVHYELMSPPGSYYPGTFGLDSTLIDLRGQIPACIRFDTTGSLQNGVVHLAWMPHAYDSTGEDAKECNMPSGWPWGQSWPRITAMRAERDATLSEDSFWGLQLDSSISIVSISEYSADITLNDAEVAMGFAYNAFQVNYEFMSSYPSYSPIGIINSKIVDLRDQIPGCIRLNVTGELVNGEVQLNWEAKAYTSTVEGAPECAMPDGWPWSSPAAVEVCGYRGYDNYTPPDDSWNWIDYASGLTGSKAITLNGRDVASGSVNNMYTVRMLLSTEPAYCGGYHLMGDVVDLKQKIPNYISLKAKTKRNANVITADWWLEAYYGTSGEIAALPEGWPWDSSWVIRLSVDSELAREYVTQTNGTISATLIEPNSNYMQLEMGNEYELGSYYYALCYSENIPASQPVIDDDPGATVIGDAESGYTITPSADKMNVEVTIPDGVDPEKVTVEIGTDVETIKANGANVKIVKDGNDITSYLDIPAADASGIIDLTQVAVKDEIVKEALDPDSGAEIKLNAESPTLTTSATKPGLTYTLNEGAGLLDMSSGDSKLGDGQPWTPNITVKGGTSGFYSIQVTK